MTAWLLAAGVGALVALVVRQRLRIAHLQARVETITADLQRTQQSCALLAPAGVVQRVISEGVEGAAERKTVTALFVDLVGYTALSESLEAPVLARVLNGYFQRVSDAVTEHRGRIGTFLGDGVLAYFGALEPNPWQSNDAVYAALALRDALHRYSRELQQEGLPPLSVGIGIHRGVGLAGLIGSRERLEYSIIGRTVNIAARVQVLTRELSAEILVTEAVHEHLDPAFQLEAMPPRAVKGVAEPVVTYAVRGAAAAASAA